jgi:hypothetical protein
MKQESILGYGDKIFCTALEDVEAGACFKMPVTLYQFVRRYIPEYLNLHHGGCKAEVM